MAIEYRTTISQIWQDDHDGVPGCIVEIGSVRVWAKNTETEVEASVPATLKMFCGEGDVPEGEIVAIPGIGDLPQEDRNAAIITAIEANTVYMTKRKEGALKKLEQVEAVTRQPMAI